MSTLSRPLRNLSSYCGRALGGLPILVLAGLMLAGCSHVYKKPPQDPDDLADYKAANDPLEPLNRTMFDINMWAYHKVLRPVGHAWSKYVPAPIRTSLRTLEETWQEPAVFFSSVGGGKPKRAGNAFMRFTINMSAGVAGFIDVAKYAGYNQIPTDPGMVMGTWGLRSGPYLFLPGVGPGSFRDTTGYAIFQALVPINYVPRGYGLLSFDWGYNVMGDFNTFADNANQLDQLEHESLDSYAFLRSAWQQNRQAQIDAFKADNGYTVPAWYPKPPHPDAAPPSVGNVYSGGITSTATAAS